MASRFKGSPCTMVRNTCQWAPPVSSQPHNLKGEAAAWVHEKLEKEVKRRLLVRGASAHGSPPFPIKEAPRVQSNPQLEAGDGDPCYRCAVRQIPARVFDIRPCEWAGRLLLHGGWGLRPDTGSEGQVRGAYVEDVTIRTGRVIANHVRCLFVCFALLCFCPQPFLSCGSIWLQAWAASVAGTTR